MRDPHREGYRLYLAENGAAIHELKAADDLDALAQALRLAGGRAAELWNGSTLLARFVGSQILWQLRGHPPILADRRPFDTRLTGPAIAGAEQATALSVVQDSARRVKGRLTLGRRTAQRAKQGTISQEG